MVDHFDPWFEQATGHPPFEYQRRIAARGLPDVLQAPMGAGKTAGIVLGWLWRRLAVSDSGINAVTPRRLIFALPMRTLVDQTERVVLGWLSSLGLSDSVAFHVVMGRRRETEQAWRLDAHRPAVVIGTIDCLISKALNRGYGMTRGLYPMDFALLCNGAHVVIDETQLATASTATMRQVNAFIWQYGAAEPTGLTCMSATIDDRVLDTVDNRFDRDTAYCEQLGDDDTSGDLGQRRRAIKTIRQLNIDAKKPRDIAQHAVERHRPGRLTIVIANTVDHAVDIRKALLHLKPQAHVILVHSQFRPRDRAAIVGRIDQAPDPTLGTILISTQVIEAGVDIDADVMITAASPWPSFCQRTGRCNRAGTIDDAEIWWYDAGSGPYADHDHAEAVRLLGEIEVQSLTGEDLLGLSSKIEPGDLELSILRRPEFLQLFDTAPDLSGADIDIAPYIRDGDQLDCQIAWVNLGPHESPTDEMPIPSQEWRCPASMTKTRALLNQDKRRSWTFDTATSSWQPYRNGYTRIVPGQIILVDASTGGYDPQLGLSPSSRELVETEPAESSALAGLSSDATGEESGSTEQQGWQTLDEHLRETAAQAEALLDVVQPDIDENQRHSVVIAALLHDLGKAHPDWQRALRATADTQAPTGLLAKSPGHGRLTIDGKRGFRHELLGAIALEAHATNALRNEARVDDTNLPLVTYLVAAHHGKVRIQARDARSGIDVDNMLLGVTPDEHIPAMRVLDTEIDGFAVDLSRFRFGAANSWTLAALRLRDQLGPIRLAYLEMLVRVTDWRASAGRRLPRETA